MNKNEWIGLAVYVGILAILCMIFVNYQIVIAVLGIMGFTGYMRTRHLRTQDKEKIYDHKGNN